MGPCFGGKKNKPCIVVTGTLEISAWCRGKRWPSTWQSPKSDLSPLSDHTQVCVGIPSLWKGRGQGIPGPPGYLQRHETSSSLTTTSFKWKHSTGNCGKCSSPVSSLPSKQPPPSNGLQPAGHFSGALHPAMSYCPQSHQFFPMFLSWQQATAFSLPGDRVARPPCRQSLLPSAPSLQGENASSDCGSLCSVPEQSWGTCLASITAKDLSKLFNFCATWLCSIP